jgi:8-oxo-dGTP diphosphatase
VLRAWARRSLATGQPVAVAVVTSGRGVLVASRADGRPPWTFPGGKIRDGESPAAAAVRELAEETGVAGTPVGEIGRRVHPATGVLIVYVAVRAAGAAPGARDGSGLGEVRWASLALADALMPEMYESVREHLAAIIGEADGLPGTARA